MILNVDFETRSAVDLKKVGTHDYAMHSTTDAWCMAWALGDDPVNVWRLGEPLPDPVFDHVLNGGEVHAWNAAFERVIWRDVMGRRYGWIVPELDQWRCTMVRAMAMSLPGSLEDAAKALGLPVEKDMPGNRLMQQMARPRRTESDGTLVWWDDEPRRERLHAYCAQDVVVERTIARYVRPLIPAELAMWRLDQQINDRGVRIDRDLCTAANQVVALAKTALDRRMAEITDGAVPTCTATAKLTAWVRSGGIDTAGVAKDDIADLLDRRDLPVDIRVALDLRRQAAKSSLAKIDQLLARSARDGRMRGNLQYHGAGTGRWAGRGAQLQNLPRPEMDEPEQAIEAILAVEVGLLEDLFGPPLQVVSDCIRSMITGEP